MNINSLPILWNCKFEVPCGVAVVVLVSAWCMAIGWSEVLIKAVFVVDELTIGVPIMCPGWACTSLTIFCCPANAEQNYHMIFKLKGKVLENVCFFEYIYYLWPSFTHTQEMVSENILTYYMKITKKIFRLAKQRSTIVDFMCL